MKNESIATSYCINIPEDATNGDVIKAVFPNLSEYEYSLMRFDKKWWTALYKEIKE